MARIIQFVMGSQSPTTDDRVDKVDIYQFPSIDLTKYKGMIIGSACDLVFLEQRSEIISQWVRAGGRLLYSGHPHLRVVEGLPNTRKMEFHNPEDIWLSAVESHPIFEGVDHKDLLFRTGVPGNHSFEELREIGVAGFYGRSYLTNLPDGARVLTGIGPRQLPLDVSYPLGEGEVIVHAGNDIESFAYEGTSTEGLRDAIYTYLG